MNEIMQKITEKLNVSADKAPEVYESLKWQYVFWEVSSLLNWMLIVIAIVIVIACKNRCNNELELYTKEEVLKIKKIYGKTQRILIVLFIIAAMLKILKFIFAPDIEFLEGVLG